VTMWFRASLVGVMLAGAVPASAQVAGAPQRAREAATAGRRPEALALLASHLAVSPRDVDARLLYGLVLSWERRYDEAQRELRQVLKEAPQYTDARVALMNVEWWSGRARDAHETADRILARETTDRDRFVAMGAPREAVEVSGNVKFDQPVSSNVRASTSTGSIFFDGNFLRGGMYVLKTYSGPIEVRFSDSDSFELSAGTRGAVDSQVTLKEPAHKRSTPSRFSSSLFGTFNDGTARVELTSFNGTIRILRRGQ